MNCTPKVFCLTFGVQFIFLHSPVLWFCGCDGYSAVASGEGTL